MAKLTVFDPVHRWNLATLILLVIFIATTGTDYNVDGFAQQAQRSFHRVPPVTDRGDDWVLRVPPRSVLHSGLQSTTTDTTNESNINVTYTTTTASTSTATATETAATTAQRPLCFYRSPTNGNRWTPRIELSNLIIGQELHGVIVQEKLTNMTTGPKVWLDVGVCRWSSHGTPYNRNNDTTTNVTRSSLTTSRGGWTIVTAMLRLGHQAKESVVRKKIARLRNKDTIPVFVSRMRIEQGQFEVVLTPEDVPTMVVPPPVLQSVTTLGVGDQVTGTVTKVVDYGAFIKLDGYNRGGLLHIQQVAELYQTYIDRRQGLMDSGLTMRSRVRLQVMEKGPSKRIFLDFTDDVKQMAREEQRQEQQEIERQQNELRAQLQQQRERTAKITVEPNPTEAPEEYDASRTVDDSNIVNVDDKDDMQQEEEEQEDDDVYDDYDEQREIEDALGLGMY